jgi:nucleoside-diphosphate-sugar epimerase
LVKALVVGAGGYLGRRVRVALTGHGIEVVGADIEVTPGLVDRAVDIRLPEQSFAVLHREAPDVVIDLAYMLMAASSAGPHPAVHLNILGTNGIFDAAATLGVPRVIYASSSAVYGDQKSHGTTTLTEESPAVPVTVYGHMKRFNEVMAEHYNAKSSTRFIGLRISDLHGRGKTGSFTPMDMIVRGAGGDGTVELPWTANHETSFIHVDDAAEAVAHLAMAKATAHVIYNTGGECLSMAELAAIGKEVAGVTVTCSPPPGAQLLHVSRVSGRRLSDEFPVQRRSPADWMALEIADKQATSRVAT